MTRAGPSSPPQARNRGDAGFVLVAVLWIMAALATLASIYSVYTIRTVNASQVLDDRVQAEASIRAGVEMTALQELVAPEKGRPSWGRFTIRVGRTNVDVRFRTEAARIDLNAAPAALLAGLFGAIGVDPDHASTFADRVIGWRTKPDANGDSKEAKLYAQWRIAYPPRQAPFDDALELALLPGLPQSIVERALPLVTVFNGNADIDVSTADPRVLSALPGMTPAILSAVLGARQKNPTDGKALLELLGPIKGAAAPEKPNAFRLDIGVAFDNGRRVQAEIVFRLKNNSDEPYDLLYWRDDFDGPTPLAWDFDR